MAAKRSFLSSLIDTVASTAAAELSEKLGAVSGMSERAKATMRRRLRRSVRDAMRGGVDKVASVAKNATKRAKLAEPISSIQFRVSCDCLGIENAKFGKPLDPELLREKRRARAKLFHPDRGVGTREQFQAVMDAATWLEKYNESLGEDGTER